MMGKQSEQIQMVILDIDSMIPDTHLLRRIKNCVNFDFIYEKAAPYYSPVGRKSIDPVVLIKMLLIGYLYGIKSERRLEEEVGVSLNLAYRWFCGIDLMHKVPEHSTFSQTIFSYTLFSETSKSRSAVLTGREKFYMMTLAAGESFRVSSMYLFMDI